MFIFRKDVVAYVFRNTVDIVQDGLPPAMGKALYVGMVAKKSGHRVGAMSGIIVVRYKIPIPVSVEWLRLVGRVVIVS